MKQQLNQLYDYSQKLFSNTILHHNKSNVSTIDGSHCNHMDWSEETKMRPFDSILMGVKFGTIHSNRLV